MDQLYFLSLFEQIIWASLSMRVTLPDPKDHVPFIYTCV